jgi:cyclopropane fatty-acyl-phospholipid synthase-like methyltransferase
MAAALRYELVLDGTGRLIDVGCGPGSVALLLAPLFEEVVGVDPDTGMIAAAETEAALRGSEMRAGWRCQPRLFRTISDHFE